MYCSLRTNMPKPRGAALMQGGAALYMANCGSTVGTLARCMFTGNSAAADSTVAVYNCAPPIIK